MGIVRKQAFKNSIYSYAGVILGYINILIFAKIFTPDQFGLTRVLWAIATLIGVLAHFGIPAITTRFFPFFRNKEQGHHGFLFWASLIPLAGFILVMGIFFLFREPFLSLYRENSGLLVNKYFWIFPLTFISLYTEIFAGFLRSNFRSDIPTLHIEITTRVFIFISLVLFFLQMLTFNQFLLLFTLSYGGAMLFMIISLARLGHLKDFFPQFEKFDKPTVKKLGVYGLFTSVNRFSNILNKKVDQLMLPMLINMGSAGIYTFGFYIAEIMLIPMKAINSITDPLLAEAFKEKKPEKILEIYQKTSLNLLIFGGIFFILIWVNIDQILNLVNEPEYYESKYVVFWIALAKLSHLGTGNNSQIILNSRFYKFNLVFIIFLAILTVISNLIFIPVYGVTGAAIATAISLLINNITKTFFVWWKLNLQPFTTKTIVAILICIVTYIAGQILPEMGINIGSGWTEKAVNGFSDILLKSVVLLLLFYLLIRIFKPSPDIEEIIQKVIKRFIG